MMTSQIVSVALWLNYINNIYSFQFHVKDGPNAIIEKEIHEYKIVTYTMTNNILSGIDEIIDFTHKLNFQPLKQYITDKKGKDQAIKEKYYIILYKLLDIGGEGEKITEGKQQWQNLIKHSLSSEFDKSLATQKNIINFTLTDNTLLASVKLKELVASANTYLVNPTDTIDDISKYVKLNNILDNITFIAKFLKLELQNMCEDILQLIHFKVPSTVDYKLLHSDKYLYSIVLGCDTSPNEIKCLLDTVSMQDTEIYTKLLPVPYNGYIICNLIVSDGRNYYEIIDNNARTSDCAVALKNDIENVPYYCKICSETAVIKTPMSGKILLTEELSENISDLVGNIESYPVLLSFEGDLTVKNEIFRRTLETAREYSSLSKDVISKIYMTPHDYLLNFLFDYFEVISIPTIVFVLLLFIILIIISVKNYVNDKTKLTGPNRKMIKAVKRKREPSQKRKKKNLIELVHP